MATTNVDLATQIVSRVVSVREVDMTETTFSAFEEGDELTFNVIAVSSKSQYDILQTSTVDKNLADRNYKFKIVAAGTDVVQVYGSDSTTTHKVNTPLAISSQNVMGYVTAADYDSIVTLTTTPLEYSSASDNIRRYVDQFNTTTTNSYSTTGTDLSDGITKQF